MKLRLKGLIPSVSRIASSTLQARLQAVRLEGPEIILLAVPITYAIGLVNLDVFWAAQILLVSRG
jgi:hypothetical protein